MNYRLVSKNLGYILMLMAGAMGICLGLSYVLPTGPTHSSETAVLGWGISTAITSLISGIFLVLGRKASKAWMSRRDAIGTVGVGWVVCGLFAAQPYLFCDPKLPFPEALFEAISGLTTTGATVFGDLAALPKSVLLWRSMTQWIGGLGILAMFVLVLSSLGASGKSLFHTESSVQSNEVIGTTLRQTARSLWLFYIALTIVCAAGLWAFDMTIFQAVNHAMTTVSTGGFGTENTSLSGFSWVTQVWLILFMFLSGVSFPLYVALLRRKQWWKILKEHEETWTYAAILLVAFAVLMIERALAGDMDKHWSLEAIDTAFNAVSIATTTGFVVSNYDLWPVLAKGLLIFLMVVGGCSGSTAGGLKISRLILWFKMMRIEIRRAYRPHLVVELKLNGRKVPQGTRGQLFVIITAAAAAAVVSSYLLVAFEPDESVDGCISAVLTCLSNVGPAFNEFGPTRNFAAITPPSMFLLSILMILGRLEYIAVLVLLSRALWKRY